MMNDTPDSFLFFVVGYVFFTFLVVAPRFFCGRSHDNQQRHLSIITADEVTGRTEVQANDRREADPLDQSRKSHEGIEMQTMSHSHRNGNDVQAEEAVAKSKEDLESQDISSTPEAPVSNFPRDFDLQIQRQQSQSQETQSAATTSRLRPVPRTAPLNSVTLRSLVADAAIRLIRPHDQKEPSVVSRSRRRLRANSLTTSQRSMFDERLSVELSETGGSARLRLRTRALSWSESRRPPSVTRSMASEAASNVLEVETVQGESDYYRNRYMQRSHRHRLLQRSLSNSISDRSLLPGLPMEALSPEDAADANDPGRPNPFVFQPDSSERLLIVPDLPSRWGDICELMEADYEAWKIVWLAVPSMAFACADPFLRVVLISIISYFVNTDSTVAFVLVIMFIQLTFEDLSSVLIDVETNLIYDAVDDGGEDLYTRVGSHVQLALCMQLIVLLPILLVWVFVMEAVVDWLCSSTAPDVASLAAGYAKIIVVDYLIRACCKAFMVPFCLDRHPKFDRYIELAGTALTLVAIVLVVRLDHAVFGVSSLSAIGILQVIASVVKSSVKVACVIYNGLLSPYKDGLFGRCTLRECRNVGNYFLAALPLFLGSLFELKEWQLLTLFMRGFGPMGVAAWAIMGTIWELFEAFAASLGDAGAVRVGEHLTENEPETAVRTAHKTILFATIQSLALGSLVLVIGPNVSVLLTNDVTLQNMLNGLFPMTALANFAMTFAQVHWSLVGAQGRVMAASASILLCRWLLMFPISAVCVFRLSFQLDSVAGSIAIGYATAALALAWTIIRTDWKETALQCCAQADMPPPDEQDMEPHNDGYLDEDESDDDDDSDESPIF